MSKYILFWLYGCDYCEEVMRIIQEVQEWFPVRFHFVEVSGADINRFHPLMSFYNRLYPDPNNQIAPVVYINGRKIEGYEDTLRETILTIMCEETGISHPDIQRIEDDIDIMLQGG